MPIPLLNAYAQKLPVLVAEDSLRAAERIAVGTGSFRDKHAGKRIAEGWQRQANQHRVVIRPKSKEMYAAQMAGMGIGVKSVKKVADG